MVRLACWRVAICTAIVLLMISPPGETSAQPAPWRGSILVVWYAKDSESRQAVSENCYADYNLWRRKVDFKYDYSYTSFGEMTFHQNIPLVERTPTFDPHVEVSFDRPSHARVTYSPYVYVAKGTQGSTRAIPWTKEVFCEPRVVDARVMITPQLKQNSGARIFYVEVNGSDKAVVDVGEEGKGTIVTSISLYAPCNSVPAAVYLGCPRKR